MSHQSNLNLKPNFKIVYQGKMFEVVEWEGKPGVTFEAAVRSPGVRTMIECDVDGSKGLLMTRELRREAGGWDYRLPGGKVFDTLNELNAYQSENKDVAEKALQAAMRENREEAGVVGGVYEYVETSKAGASVEWDLYYYVVTGAEVGAQELEEAETGDIETVKLSAHDIFEKLTSREIKEGRSADMLWWWLHKNGFVAFTG